MIRYNLARLAKRRKGTVQPLPAIHGSVGSETSYLKALRSMLREMAVETRESIVPVAEREIAAKRAESRITVDMSEYWFTRLAIFPKNVPTATFIALMRAAAASAFF